MSNDEIRPKQTRTRTADGAADIYDHEILLVDTTVSTEDAGQLAARSTSPGARKLKQTSPQGSRQEHLSESKYANRRQKKVPSKFQNIVNGKKNGHASTATGTQPVTEGTSTDAVDVAHAERDRGRRIGDKPNEKQRNTKSSEIDILYENQRGWFLFGIPLYSHSSLLNLDPAPWVTREFKDSAVNITNAQVPDPSWAWSWRTWYVDMSYDVDEEGWQYSFSFGNRWAWHGTHPWFHSFVRRRRWLRKREKNDGQRDRGKSRLGTTQHLKSDYFTVHAKRDQSPGSLRDADNSTARPSSYISIPTECGWEEPPEDIKKVSQLLTAMKMAKVDREKIEAVKNFVHQGGEELARLREQIPEIMSFLVYQTSRRQLLTFLKDTADDASKHRAEHEAEQSPETAAESQRIDSLIAAIEAADKEIQGLEYWSDRKHILRTSDDADQPHQTGKNQDTATTPLDDNPVDQIKGISQDAEVDLDHSSQVVDSSNERSGPREPKGKEREVASDGDAKDPTPIETRTPPRLERDAVFIPD